MNLQKLLTIAENQKRKLKAELKEARGEVSILQDKIKELLSKDVK